MTRERDRPEKFGVYKDRGVYVPEGMNAEQIMLIAGVLEDDFEMTPYTSRSAARAIISALLKKGIPA